MMDMLLRFQRIVRAMAKQFRLLGLVGSLLALTILPITIQQRSMRLSADCSQEQCLLLSLSADVQFAKLCADQIKTVNSPVLAVSLRQRVERIDAAKKELFRDTRISIRQFPSQMANLEVSFAAFGEEMKEIVGNPGRGPTTSNVSVGSEIDDSRTVNSVLSQSTSGKVCNHCGPDSAGQSGVLADLSATSDLVQRFNDRRTSLSNHAHVAVALLALAFALVFAFATIYPLRVQVQSATDQMNCAVQASEQRADQLKTFVGELRASRDDGGRRAMAMLNLLTDLRRERAQLEREALVRERTERQFRSVVEAAPHAMLMVCKTGKISLVNEAAETIFQYTRAELVGRDVTNVIPEFDPSCGEQRSTLVGEGREFLGRRRDGSEFHVEVGINPIDTDDEVSVLISVVDISANKLAFESTSKLAAIVKNSQDAIVGKALDGTITSWNAGAEQIYGYTSEEMIGRHFSTLVPQLRLKEAEDIFLLVSRGQHIDSVETIGCRNDGKLIDVSLTASAITDSGGVVVGASVISRDITHQKRAAKELEKYASDLKGSNQELEQFAYVASHDLKEPLRMVSNYTSLLAEEYAGRLDEDADRYIAYATDGAKRMSVLIDDLLNYSRVGRMDDPFEPTSLDEVMSHVTKDLSASVDEAGAEINVIDPLPVIQGNPSRLHQLFLNLLGNAMKFRHPDRAPTVQVTCRPVAGMWEIAVEDNGVGIEKDFYERVFQLFQRLHTIDEYPGTGIGLAVCKKIVEQHGGSIRIESEIDVSTTFVLSLPQSISDPVIVAPLIPSTSFESEPHSCNQ